MSNYAFILKEDLRGKNKEYINNNYPPWFRYALDKWICFIDNRGLFVKYKGGNRGVLIGDMVYIRNNKVRILKKNYNGYVDKLYDYFGDENK